MMVTIQTVKLAQRTLVFPNLAATNSSRRCRQRSYVGLTSTPKSTTGTPASSSTASAPSSTVSTVPTIASKGPEFRTTSPMLRPWMLQIPPLDDDMLRKQVGGRPVSSGVAPYTTRASPSPLLKHNFTVPPGLVMSKPAAAAVQKRGFFNFLSGHDWKTRFLAYTKAWVRNTKEVSDEEHNSRVFAVKVGFCCAASGALPFLLSATSGKFIDMGCGIAALVTVIVVSDYTVGGVLANGVYRVRATVAGATLALLGSEVVKALPFPNEPMVGIAMMAGTIPIFYIAQRWVDYKPVMILFGLTYNLSLVDMVMATNAGPFLILQRLMGVILGLGVALPVHIGLQPHYSATHALHITERNADLVASFTWRAIRAFERDKRADYNTFLATESALGRGETTSVHDCFAMILLSRAELETQIKNARWETAVSGLTDEDLDRIDAIQTGLRRAAAIGVNMDMQVASEFSQGAKLGTLVHTEALRLVERNIVRALRTIRPILSGPVEEGDLRELTNARAGLSVANQALEREKIRILTQLVRDRDEPETCMRAVHFCSLLQDLATEVQLILRHPDYAPRDAPRVPVWRHVRELRA